MNFKQMQDLCQNNVNSYTALYETAGKDKREQYYKQLTKWKNKLIRIKSIQQ